MKRIRRWLFAACMGAAGLGLSLAASAQDYPQRPVRIIVAYPAGQAVDVLTRYVAEELNRATGGNFFIDNRVGAGGNIGTADAARAQPDGYTLVMGTNGTHAMNPYLYASTGFDAAKDFEPIILVGTFPMVLAAPASSPLQDLRGVLAAVKQNPKAADVALPSTTARLVLELMRSGTQSELFGVPYKGSAAAATDVLGGQLPLLIDTVSAVRPFIAAGKLRPLAVSSAKASMLLPGVSSMRDQGIEGMDVVAWDGLYAPRGTPAAIVRKLNETVARILARPEARRKLAEMGFEAGGGTPEQFGAFTLAEQKRWGPLIAQAGLRAE
ncbi:tripartite tricarboxylate transporter substrate binding protein [soil metagenome]